MENALVTSLNQNQFEPQDYNQNMQQGETAGQVLSAQVKSLIESRFIVAKKMPRDIDIVRQKLLKECKRPYFAEVAIYTRPVSSTKSVSGPSIRFAETAIRCMGNIVIDTYAIYDDSSKRIIRVSASDIESNTSYSIDVTIPKTVERKFAKQGDIILNKRLNSKNELLYILQATDDELITKQNALISKAVRTLGLRLIPGDLIDECIDEIKQTQNQKDKEDPDRSKNKIFDSFETIGVSVEQIKEYLGHELNSLTPAEIADLRGIYQSIKDGEMSWRDVSETIGNVPRTKSDKDLLPTKPKEEKPKEEQQKDMTLQQKIDSIKSAIGAEYIQGFQNYLHTTNKLKQIKTIDDIEMNLADTILKQMVAFKAKAIEYTNKKENTLL